MVEPLKITEKNKHVVADYMRDVVEDYIETMNICQLNDAFAAGTGFNVYIPVFEGEILGHMCIMENEELKAENARLHKLLTEKDNAPICHADLG